MSHVDRRAFLQRAAVTGAAVGGAAWAAPSVLGFQQAFAIGSNKPPAPGVGTYQSLQGNNVATIPLPTGTFSTYVMAIATSAGNAPTVAGTGWTLLTSILSPTVPGFLIYTAAGGAAAPTTNFNSGNEKYAVQIFGFTSGTVTAEAAGTIASTSTTPLTSVGGLSGQTANTVYALIGATTSDTVPNFTTPTNYTKYSEVSSSQHPNIYLALYDAMGTSVPSTSFAYTQAGSAVAVQVAIN